MEAKNNNLKEPSSVTSIFFQTLGDFAIRRKLVFFSLPLLNFIAERCTVWKILIKMWLVMVTIIKFIQWGIGNYKTHYPLLVYKRFNRFNWNLKPRFLGDEASFEWKSPFWEIAPGTFNVYHIHLHFRTIQDLFDFNIIIVSYICTGLHDCTSLTLINHPTVLI